MLSIKKATIHDFEEALHAHLKEVREALANSDLNKDDRCEILSNIYHHAHALLNEHLQHYTLKQSIEMTMASLDPAHKYADNV